MIGFLGRDLGKESNTIGGCSVFGGGRKKRAGEICSVFDIGDFCRVFN